MPKLKSHKALLKRVRVTGRGKVKFRKSNTGHLMSGKTASKRRHLRRPGYAKAGDIGRLTRLLHLPLIPQDRLSAREAAEKLATEQAAEKAATEKSAAAKSTK